MSDEHVICRVDDRVCTLTINREARKNALSPEAIEAFHGCLDRVREDPDVRVVCITGAGGSAFCTGAELGDGLSDKSRAVFLRYAELLKKIHLYPKPTLAKVRGYCLAGGMGLMLACDISIASDDSRFGTPEVNVGLWPMMIGALIFRNTLRKRAMEMILLGDRMSAEEALSMGLLSRVSPAPSLDREVNDVIEKLASKSPIGIRIGKEAFNTMAGMPFEEALEYLSGRFAEVAGTEDAREGITAFLEKRLPVFKGK